MEFALWPMPNNTAQIRIMRTERHSDKVISVHNFTTHQDAMEAMSLVNSVLDNQKETSQ